MSTSYDVAIVGAGIVGAACALECAREGLRTCVIEANQIGGGATGAGMGHLTVMDDSEAQFALTRYSCKLWRALAQDLPEDAGFDPCGTIWVAADEVEVAAVRSKQKWYEERGEAAEILDAQSLADAEPNLRPGLAGGLLVRGDCVIYPPRVAQLLIERAQELGAAVHLGRRAVDLSDAGVTLEDGTRIAAGIAVNAAGCWSPALANGLEVRKRKGHLVITDRYPGFVRHQIVELGYLKSAHSHTEDSVACNIQPRSTGQLLIGSSRQFGVEGGLVDASILRRMVKRACEYMPGLARVSAIRVWTGFRPATPDNLPFIGPSPDCRNVYLATGHEGLGITNSLATASLLVDQLLKRTPEIPCEPYLPARVHEEAH